MYRYETNADGRHDVVSKEKLKKDDLVVIKDAMYTGDMEVFRVRKAEESRVELRLLKAVGLKEDIKGNCEIEGVIYGLEGRLSKNQMFVVGRKAGKVINIEKRRGEADLVEVEWLSYIEVDSRYIINKRSLSGGEVEEYLVVNSYKEVISELSKARVEKKDEGTFWL